MWFQKREAIPANRNGSTAFQDFNLAMGEYDTDGIPCWRNPNTSNPPGQIKWLKVETTIHGSTWKEY